MCQIADRFYAAVRTLASDQAAKERLAEAYLGNLHALGIEDVPESVRPRFELLRKALNGSGSGPVENRVRTAARKMSVADATRYSRSIVAMFGDLVRVRTTGERLGAVEIQRAKPKPAGLLRQA
jgi:hypothetical protein